MILYPVAILLALGAMVTSIVHLRQPIASYYDFVALTVVVGGTVAVAVIILPWEYGKEILRGFGMLIYRKPSNPQAVVRAGMELVQTGSAGAFLNQVPRLPQAVLRDGQEMIRLGIKVSSIETVLRERIFQSGRRAKRVANAVRSLAKYPPAFGLMGTVLGLVNLMRGIAAGLTAQQTGVEMSVALVATMYGLLMANLFVNPAGELILKKAQEDEELAEVALQSVLLAAERVSVLEAQEMLNSFVSESDRVDVIGNYIQTLEQEAA